MDTKKLKFPFEKRILITGGGSGLGRALALEFASKNWKIAVADINEPRALETVGLVAKAGGQGMALACDVTKEEDLQSAANLLLDQWGGVDILVNNAGVAAAGYLEKISQEQWDWIIDINLKSAILGCRVFIPILEKQGGGHIVCTASAAGFASLPEMSCYNVTKAAVISLTETLRVELAPKNIGVTVVTPTFFKTNLMDQFRFTDERQKKIAETFFTRSFVSSEAIARHTYKSIKKNRLYVLTQVDGRFMWLTKRLFPELYFNVMRHCYKIGLFDKIMKA